MQAMGAPTSKNSNNFATLHVVEELIKPVFRFGTRDFDHHSL